MLQAGGLRPAGPPCTLARGDPTIPAPLAWLSRCRSVALAGGLRPAGPPCTLARGDPTIPAPLAWLSRCRSVALAGGLRPAGPPCTLARGDPTIPAPLAWLSRCRSVALAGGLRPAGPPRTLARGDPTIPAPLAWLSRCRSVALTGGLRPAGPPCTLARGDPTIPAPLVSGRRGPLHPAWLTALRSRFVARSAPLARLSRCRAVASRVGLGLQLLEDLLDAVVLGDRGVVEELELRHAPQAHPLPDLAPQERRRPCEGLAGLALRLRVAVGRVVDARDRQIGGDLDLRQGQEADAGIVHLARDELRQLDADLLADLFGPVACHGVSSSQ